MKYQYRSTRRRFLKNTLIAGSMSPLAMRIAQPVLAQNGENIPKVCFMYFPDGVYAPKNADGTTSDSEGEWHPKGNGTPTGAGYAIENNPTLNNMTKVFEPLKQHMTFIQGLDMKLGGGSHQGGAQKVLTGNGKNSLDVALGQVDSIGGSTPIRNINLGAMANFQAGTTDHVHYLNGVSIKPEDDPVAAFNRIYGLSSGGGVSNPDGYDPRRDIISQSFKELQALMGNVIGNDEKIKLETHIDALNDLQKKLDGISVGGNSGGGGGGLCEVSSFNPTNIDTSSPEGIYPPKIHFESNYTDIANLQTDIITRMLGCGMTRIASLQQSHTTSNFRSHHSISHNFSPAWIRSLNYFYGFLVKLVNQMKDTPDGTSNLLDNTLIFCYSCLSDGKLHDHRDMPFFLIGGHNFGFKGNRKIRYDLNAEGDNRGVDHTKLLVSIARYMGHDINKFGTNPVSGELPGLYDA